MSGDDKIMRLLANQTSRSRGDLAAVFERWLQQMQIFGFSRHIALVSPLSVEDCLNKVGCRILRDTSNIRGRLEGNVLKARKRISYRNSFQRILTGRFEEADRGTKVVCDFAFRRSVKIFMFFWFGFLAFFTLATTYTLALGALIHHTLPVGEVIMPAFAPLMAGFGYTMMKFGVALSIGDEEFLISTLNHELNSKPWMPDNRN